MKFLIDECLSPKLVAVANERGFEAYHVAHRRWGGIKDPQLFLKLVDENLILVTNNRDDFLSLIRGVELHPGLVVIIENVRRAQQVVFFKAALDAMKALGSMINKVIEVSAEGDVEVYEMPLIE